MNRKKWQKMIWLLVMMMLLAACGGAGNNRADTAVSQPSPTKIIANTEVAEPAIAEANDNAEPEAAPEMEAETQPEPEPETEDEAEPTLVLADLAGLEDDQKAIQLLASETAVAQFLSDYPDWNGESWPENDASDIWSIDLYSEAADEWLGWGMVNINTGEILDYFVPRDLSPEEFQAGMAKVENLVLNDAGVQARLGDPALWEHETYYNRWDEQWEVWFAHGLDELLVTVYMDEEYIYLEDIIDPSQLEAEKEAELQRDQAVELAWSADGIDQALDGVDNWHTLVASRGDLWAVSFVSDDQELFFALVDIDNQTIVEAK